MEREWEGESVSDHRNGQESVFSVTVIVLLPLCIIYCTLLRFHLFPSALAIFSSFISCQ